MILDVEFNESNCAIPADFSEVYVIREKEISEEIPTKLPNPYKLNLTGAVDATYDGSEEVTVEIPEVDLSPYAKKEEIPSIENLATKEYVDTAVDNIDIPKVDLSPYALKTDIPDVSEYQTAEQVTALIKAELEVIENGTY